MKEIQYFEILKRSAILTWKNKKLWFFGFLALLGSVNPSIRWDASSFDSQALKNITNTLSGNPLLILSISLLVIAFYILILWLKGVGIVSISKAANNIAVYRQSKIGKIFSEAQPYAWRVVLLDVLVTLTLIAIMFFLFAPAVYMFFYKEYVSSAIIFVLAVAIFFTVAIIAFFVRLYSFITISLSQIRIKESLEFAYSVFRKNVKESLLMGFLNIALNIALGFSLLLIFLLMAILFLPFGLVVFYLMPKEIIIALAIFAGMLYLVLAIIIGSAYSLFMQSAWVFFFKEITLEKKDKSIEEKVADKLPSPEPV